VLHQLRADPQSAHIDTPEKLFEYFLMDVQMDSCMQTSRVRHALSSVQLYVERCFMNLEPEVAPSAFEAKHRKQWEWMKRYRVWEANRKVFLWPENWVEPELRGDQSPFFKEALSELLQSDITEDRAATALGNYLAKLEEVAKLEPCGVHAVEGEAGTADDVVHVVARTAGAGRKYFYRRHDGLWTPWEQIKLDIEDDPVLPVVWRGRLFLFWLKILKQAPLDAPAPPPADTELGEMNASAIVPSEVPKVEIQALLCWSEYYNGKWQAARTSSADGPAFIARMDPDAFRRSMLALWPVETEHYLRILITRDDPGASYFNVYNAHGMPAWGTKVNYVHDEPRRLDTSGGAFTITYGDGNGDTTHPVLNAALAAERPVQPHHVTNAAWAVPFFYRDPLHVFHVTTTRKAVPIQDSLSYFDLSDVATSAIGSLIMPEYQPPGPGPYELGLAGVQGASSMKRFVSGDAYIKRGIPMTGTVSLNGAAIGPSGGVVDAVDTS
jgi:hypothetical protein